jgi:hypothetical protein
MTRHSHVLRVVLLAVGVLAGARAAEPFAVRLIGVRSLAPRQTVDGTRVGGFSGIDYDAAADCWLAISDDRSEHSPARFYTVKLDYDEKAVRAAEVTGATVLRQRDGTEYPDRPGAAKRGGDVPDFEALRLDPRDGSVWYASEGDSRLKLNPFVRRANRDGTLAAELPLPAQWRFTATANVGPRYNLTLESLTFSPDGESWWTALEAPLQQDGAASTQTTGGTTRLTRLARDGRMLAQYAYGLDAWQLAPAAGREGDNGLSEMLALPSGRLLTLERSGAEVSAGRWAFAARLYEVDVAGATDVKEREALGGTFEKIQPAAKRLVVDFSQAGQAHVDNLEGLAWGRRLPSGHATLVVVSDDNFLPNQETQFWVFEVLSTL